LRLELDAGALEGDLGVVGDVEEVVGAEVVVAVGVAGVDAGDVDLALEHRAGEVLLIELDRAAVGLERAARGRHHEVLDRETNMAVNGVELPGHENTSA